MRKRSRLTSLLVVTFVAAIWAGALAAQTPPPPYYWVYTEHVAMADIGQYEAVTKEMVDKMKATEEGKKVEFLTLSGPEMGYIYAVPMDDMNGHGKMMEDFGATVVAAGIEDQMKSSMSMVDRAGAQIFRYREDLSYRPAEPGEVEQSAMGRQYNWWYGLPGHEEQLEQVARDYVAAYKEHNLGTGFRVYQAMTGPELPLYLVVITAESPADFYSTDHKISEKLGEAGQKLMMAAASHARRVDLAYATIRPELSMMPGGDEGMDKSDGE